MEFLPSTGVLVISGFALIAAFIFLISGMIRAKSQFETIQEAVAKIDPKISQTELSKIFLSHFYEPNSLLHVLCKDNSLQPDETENLYKLLCSYSGFLKHAFLRFFLLGFFAISFPLVFFILM